ncbi:MAG: hypothetical protein ACT4SY_14515 [Hyphomicrobiales bacterium]
MKVVSSICRNPILLVSARVEFKATTARQHAGFIHIQFSVRNTSTIEATQPFICFPATGLQFARCPGWSTGYFLSDSGRRMIRFVPRSGHPLAAGESVTACMVRLPFARSGGGTVTIARGVERRLAELPHLRLFVIAGAGNFAPERSSVVVPVNEMLAAIRRGLPKIELQTAMSFAG